MSLNFVSAGIFFNWITNFILAFLLMKSNYDISQHTFAGLLLFNLLFWSFIVGKLSAKYELSSKVNGFFVGTGSSIILFVFLFIYAEPHFETNIYMLALWMTVGMIGGWAGSFFTFAKRKKQLISKI